MAIVEVVKYNGTPDVFAWKFPNEELGTWTQLIVNESQEAVLFKGGKALDLFTSGRHTLSTANIPLLNKIINLPFGGRSPFTAEVWYVNKVHSLDIKWGTSTPIQLQDPKYGIFVPVRSFGQFGIRIADSRAFLTKLVGTMPAMNKDNLVQYFRGLYLTKAKDAISSYLVHKQVSIMEINAYLDELSGYLNEKMQPVMAEYGIDLVNFYVNDVSVPEDDPAVKKLKDALAKRAEMDIVGYNYQQERSFDTLEGAAKNPGAASSGLMGAGMGLGMGVAMGGPMGSAFGGIAQNLNTTATKPCPKCQAPMDAGKRFCSTCGFDTHKENEEAPAAEIHCNKCGALLKPTSKFCPECGDRYDPCPECGADLPLNATTCPVCGKVLPVPCPACGAMLDKPNAKFCPECGVSLQKTCPNCGAKIEGSPKFCLECGKKLAGDDQ